MIKKILLIYLLITVVKAENICSDSTVFVDNVCLTVEDISKTAGTAGHISSVFYGLGSGFNSVYGIVYGINSISAGSENSNQFIRILPSSLTFATAGSINQIVKLKRKRMLQKLGTYKMKCRPLLLAGIVLFTTSVGTDLLNNLAYFSDKEDLHYVTTIINSTVLTSSFIVNVIGKVVQAKELDQKAEELVKERKISIAPFMIYQKNKYAAGISLKF